MPVNQLTRPGNLRFLTPAFVACCTTASQGCKLQTLGRGRPGNKAGVQVPVALFVVYFKEENLW